MAVFDRLSAEAQVKGEGDPAVQKVIDALIGTGLTVARQQQHLGSPIGARYCMGVNTNEHLTISICQYADPKTAEAGAAVSRKAFAAIENRAVHVRRATTLAIIQVPKDQVSIDAEKKAVAAFEAL